jgi:cholesterol transport system auxiliary component
MTALRRTRPGDRLPFRTWVRVAALVLPVGLFGCGSATPPGPDPSPHAAGANDPAWIVNRPALPPPDTDRINYDERTRTLTLYDLPGNDRWVVRLPGEPAGRPVTAQHRIPDADPSEVMVYYVRPGYKPSVSVSVKQIQECGNMHVSLAPR